MRLDDSRAFWRLKAGTADVFAVDPSQGGRLFLLRVTAGSHLIAEPASGGAQLIEPCGGSLQLRWSGFVFKQKHNDRVGFDAVERL